MTRLLFSAGEASGDMHAADLIAALKARVGELEMYGMGGPLMQQAGVELLFNPTSMSTVGFVEALKSVQVMRRVLGRLGDAMDRRPPDAVVCIDFSGFNMKLAELARRKGLPVVYYLPPSAWAWGRGRAEKLARLGVTVCAALPVEVEAYREAGAEVVFVGHPLVDRVKPSAPAEDVRRELGVGPDRPLIALLPGSREQELKQLLPPMLEAAAVIFRERPDARFALPVAHTLSAQTIKRFLPQDAPPLAVLEGRTYDVMHAADAAMISMGTATLEAALLGLPHVACYRVSGATYALARRLIKISHFALPNIIAGREIVPELVQADVTGEKLARAVLPMLEPQRREELRARLSRVREALGDGDAAGKAADIILAKARARAPQEQ